MTMGGGELVQIEIILKQLGRVDLCGIKNKQHEDKV